MTYTTTPRIMAEAIVHVRENPDCSLDELAEALRLASKPLRDQLLWLKTEALECIAREN